MRQYLKKSEKKNKKIVLTAALFIGFIMVGCSTKEVSDKTDSYIDRINMLGSDSDVSITMELTDVDNIVDYDESAKVIDLSTVNEDVLEITDPGTYVLSGQYNGRLYVDVDDESVHIILNNANIYSKSGAALYIKSAAKAVLTSMEGTKNSLTDSVSRKAYEDENACVYAKCDLTLNGTGELYIYGYYKDGVKSKDILKVSETNLSVLSKRDGLRGNDGVFVSNASLNVQCEKTGIKTKNANGNIEIVSGTCMIIAGKYGIDSAGNVYTPGALLDIKAVVDAVHADGNVAAE